MNSSYPYHKWFLRVLASAPDRPCELSERIAAVYEEPSARNINRVHECVVSFRDWERPSGPWPVQFMADSELNWMDGPTPVDDV